MQIHTFSHSSHPPNAVMEMLLVCGLEGVALEEGKAVSTCSA